MSGVECGCVAHTVIAFGHDAVPTASATFGAGRLGAARDPSPEPEVADLRSLVRLALPDHDLARNREELRLASGSDDLDLVGRAPRGFGGDFRDGGLDGGGGRGSFWAGR